MKQHIILILLVSLPTFCKSMEKNYPLPQITYIPFSLEEINYFAYQLGLSAESSQENSEPPQTDNKPLETDRKLSQTHYELNTMQSKFYCTVQGCSIYSHFKKSIKTHILSHTENRPHSCLEPFCHAAFVKEFNLTQHYKVHNKEIYKAHQCLECNKKFIRESSLRTHLTCHDKRRYKCKECGARYKTERDLARHIPTPHETNGFLCASCKKKFNSFGAKMIHARKKHKRTKNT